MQRKLLLNLILVFGTISFPASAIEINIDGKLDEEEWASARQITKYYETMPFTLAEPSHSQKVLILEDEKGIYFGFINIQKNETIRKQKHQRDEEMANADMVGVSLDFDGDGLLSYGFTISAGGSINDNVVRNENEMDYDWDADWKHGAHIEGDAWYAEMFIPWTIAPMKAQKGTKRKIKYSFYRWLRGDFIVYTTTKGNPRTEKFLSLFDEIEFNNYDVSKIDFFPYLNLTDDRVVGEEDTKLGAEIFWKIDAGKQLNIALNPDFGQVESDELVVNFNSSETFYSDKRPFFSENHSLFDVKGYEFFYVINTRRIGAAPDYDCSSYTEALQSRCESSKVGISDIDYAIRYTQQNESYDLGFLSASESDEDFSQGRDFYSLRLRKAEEKFSIGYLGTFTDRPVLDRDATVHAMDLIYRPSDKLRFDTILINSQVNQLNRDLDAGNAFRFRLTASPNKNRYHDIGIFYFDENLDITDMGYQMENNWLFVGAQNGLKYTDFSDSSVFNSNIFELGVGYEANGDFDKAADFTYLSYKGNFKNSSFIEIVNFYRTPSKDFWITRKNKDAPFVKKPENYGFNFQFSGPSKQFFNYFLEMKREKGSQWRSAMGFATSYGAKISFSPRSNLNFSLYHGHTKESNWLNWLQDDLLGIYSKKQRMTVADLNWFGGDRHELRVKAQLVAFTARKPSAYLGDFSGNLNPINIDLEPFTLSDLAFQVRYRYEILPLAYLYVVYSRGGRIIQNDLEDNLGEIYKRPWNEPQADAFTVKVRYRF